MEAGHKGVTIYTIGHGNATDERLVELLRQFAISVVVDVRTVPYSQYTHQFNRELWNNTLKAAGIAYKFAGEYLGGRPDDTTCYKNGELPGEKANYLELVDYHEVAKRPWYQRGLDRLLRLAAEQPTTIMCSEEDPRRCHRHHLIAQTLLEAGHTVVHIRGDGRYEAAELVPRQLGLF